jgi:hypothetical protein
VSSHQQRSRFNPHDIPVYPNPSLELVMTVRLATEEVEAQEVGTISYFHLTLIRRLTLAKGWLPFLTELLRPLLLFVVSFAHFRPRTHIKETQREDGFAFLRTRTLQNTRRQTSHRLVKDAIGSVPQWTVEAFRTAKGYIPFKISNHDGR